MRIFGGLLLVIVSVVLFMLPITRAIYNFRTDLREDTFNVETGGAETTANVSLFYPIFEDDTTTIGMLSSLPTDIPLFSAYNTTTRLLDITGMTVASNRSLRVFYDINALIDNDALETFLDWVPYIWLIVIAVIPIAALYFIFKGGRR